VIAAIVAAWCAPAAAQIQVLGHEYHAGDVLRFSPLSGVDIFPAAHVLAECSERHGTSVGPEFDYGHAGVPTTYDHGKRTVIIRRGDVVTVVAVDRYANLEFRKADGETGACVETDFFQFTKTGARAKE